MAWVEPGSVGSSSSASDAGADLGHGLVFRDPGLHGVDARSMAGEVDEEDAPSERIVEGAAQRDAHGAVDNRSAQDLHAALLEGIGRDAERFELASRSSRHR